MTGNKMRALVGALAAMVMTVPAGAMTTPVDGGGPFPPAGGAVLVSDERSACSNYWTQVSAGAAADAPAESGASTDDGEEPTGTWRAARICLYEQVYASTAPFNAVPPRTDRWMQLVVNLCDADGCEVEHDHAGDLVAADYAFAPDHSTVWLQTTAGDCALDVTWTALRRSVLPDVDGGIEEHDTGYDVWAYPKGEDRRLAAVSGSLCGHPLTRENASGELRRVAGTRVYTSVTPSL